MNRNKIVSALYMGIQSNIKLQEDILKLEAWCNSWQLSINEDKSEVLRLGTHNPHFPYTLNGTVIPTKSSCRDLGVQIGENAYYRKHYETKTRTCHFLCKQFRSSFATNDKEFLVFLFRTYIIPKIEYASNVWSPYYKKDINTLENVQRKFTKFLPGMFRKSYLQRMAELGLITLEERRIYLDSILMYKIVHGLVEIDFGKYFSINTVGTRGHPYKLNVLGSRINCHKYHFFNRIVRIWNSLPSEIVNKEKLCMFKDIIYTFDVKTFCIGRAFT